MGMDDDDVDQIPGVMLSARTHLRRDGHVSISAVGKGLLKRLASRGASSHWQAFLGSCVLAGAALLPHAPIRPVLAGMALAAFMRYVWSRLTSGRGRPT